MNSALIKGNSQDIEEFACLLEKEGRKRNNKDKNAVCLVTYEKSTDINLFEVYNTWLGSSNKVLFSLPEDKAKAYKHLLDKELPGTPKFKVGDSVSYLGQNCTIRGFTKDGTDIMVEGYSKGHSGSYNEWYYDENGEMQDLQVSTKSDRHYTTLKEIQLIKSTNTNMKYKVIKWYPGCEVTKERVGEVIETSNNYSTQEYKEFYEEVKVDTLQDLLKNCKFKVGETLPTLLLRAKSTYSSNGRSPDTLEYNVGFEAADIQEFTLINNKAYFKTYRKNTKDVFYFEVSILESIERTKYVDWSLSKDRNAVNIGCQKYTKEDCLSFLNTLARAGQESMIFQYNSTSVPVSYADIMYVYCLLKDN